MRKQIAAANWKMNLTIQQGEQLLDAIIAKPHSLSADQQAVFAVPFPYLAMAQQKIAGKKNVFDRALLASCLDASIQPVCFSLA